MNLSPLTRRQFFVRGGAALASPCILPAAVWAGEAPASGPRAEKGGGSMFEHIVVRGDEACWARDENGGYPFVDMAVAAGATGLHAWAKASRETLDAYIAHCHSRKITVHAGIGVGGYGVANDEDPREPAVLQKIKDHIGRTMESHNYDGIEFQTGEYDAAYSEAEAKDNAWAHKLVDSLNPVVECALSLKKSLWIRTELHMGHFTDADVRIVSQGLDRRCTVEWSEHTGPFDGPGAFTKGRELLALDGRFSWFLKILYYNIHFWHQAVVGREEAREFLLRNRGARGQTNEIAAPPMTSDGMRVWAAQWREWIGMLHEARRTTLTICHCPPLMPQPDSARRLLLAGVALAKKPEMGDDDVMAILGLRESGGQA